MAIEPYLFFNGCCEEAIEFYRRAFGATESFRLDAPGGKVGHAEIQIGDSRIMMADDCGGESPFRNPQTSDGSPVGLHCTSKMWTPSLIGLLARAQRSSNRCKTSCTATEPAH